MLKFPQDGLWNGTVQEIMDKKVRLEVKTHFSVSDHVTWGVVRWRHKLNHTCPQWMLSKFGPMKAYMCWVTANTFFPSNGLLRYCNGPLKCHWDQNFGIPCFYIFEHSLWFLVTMPNFNLLRRLEVAFVGRFLSRFCGRHYWPLFRKLACEWAEVTSEAHLKPSAFTWLLPTGK